MEDSKKVDETIPRKQICYGHKRWGGHMGVVVDYQKELSGEIEKEVGGMEPLNKEHGERQQRGLKQSRNRVDCIS
jgi:hypothetical protein